MIELKADSTIEGVLIWNSLNYFTPKSGWGPELKWAEQVARASNSSCWKSRGTMGEDWYRGGHLFLHAFKENLLGSDLKLSHIVMETLERYICILLEVKVKTMKL